MGKNILANLETIKKKDMVFNYIQMTIAIEDIFKMEQPMAQVSMKTMIQKENNMVFGKMERLLKNWMNKNST